MARRAVAAPGASGGLSVLSSVTEVWPGPHPAMASMTHSHRPASSAGDACGGWTGGRGGSSGEQDAEVVGEVGRREGGASVVFGRQAPVAVHEPDRGGM